MIILQVKLIACAKRNVFTVCTKINNLIYIGGNVNLITTDTFINIYIYISEFLAFDVIRLRLLVTWFRQQSR